MLLSVARNRRKLWMLSISKCSITTHNRLTALFPGLPGWAGTRKVKPIWISLKQETVSDSGISWAIICKSAPRSRQITTPAPHHSVFYRPDALPAAQPTASKHWRQTLTSDLDFKYDLLTQRHTHSIPFWVHNQSQRDIAAVNSAIHISRQMAL